MIGHNHTQSAGCSLKSKKKDVVFLNYNCSVYMTQPDVEAAPGLCDPVAMTLPIRRCNANR